MITPEDYKLCFLLAEYFGAPAVATAAGVAHDRALAWKARGHAVIVGKEPRAVYLRKPAPTRAQIDALCAFAQRATEDVHYQMAVVRMQVAT